MEWGELDLQPAQVGPLWVRVILWQPWLCAVKQPGMGSRAFPSLWSLAGILAHQCDSSPCTAIGLGESSEELSWSLSRAVLGLFAMWQFGGFVLLGSSSSSECWCLLERLLPGWLLHAFPSLCAVLCFQGSFLLLQHEEHPELLLCPEL